MSDDFILKKSSYNLEFTPEYVVRVDKGNKFFAWITIKEHFNKFSWSVNKDINRGNSRPGWNFYSNQNEFNSADEALSAAKHKVFEILKESTKKLGDKG